MNAMKHIKLCIVLLLAAAALFLTACGEVVSQGEPAQTANMQVASQAPASQVPTLAAEPQQGASGQPAAAQPSQQTTQAPQQPSAAGGISLEKAKAVALADAGLSALQTVVAEAWKVIDGGIAKYAVAFVKDGWEYAYEIHAGTGIILESERKREATSQPAQPISTQPPQTNASGEIGLEKAKEIALADAGFSAAQVKFKKAGREKERGVVIYEIEFVKDGREYKYEIHGGTGVILKSKGKRVSEAAPAPPEITWPFESSAASDISLEAAMEIALAAAEFIAQARF